MRPTIAPRGSTIGAAMQLKAPVRGKEMFAPIDGRRRLHRKRKTERIGAARVLAPHAAGNDVAPRRAVGERLIAQRIEHHAFRIGEGDHEIRAGDLRVKRLHFGERQAAQRLESLALARDLRKRRDDRSAAASMDRGRARHNAASSRRSRRGSRLRERAGHARAPAAHGRSASRSAWNCPSFPGRWREWRLAEDVQFLNASRRRLFRGSTAALSQATEIPDDPLRRRACAGRSVKARERRCKGGSSMKAQVLQKYDDALTAKQWVAEEKVADPKMEKSTDVIVRIGGAGVCRTDLHIIEGVWRPFTDPTGDKLLPLIMGHENAGWVEEVGKEVEGIKVGDPVIVHPKITGGTCLACRRGFDMHGPGKFPGPRLQRRLCRVSLHLRAQHRAAAEDARAEGGRPLRRRRPHRLSRGEEGDAPAAARARAASSSAPAVSAISACSACARCARPTSSSSTSPTLRWSSPRSSAPTSS